MSKIKALYTPKIDAVKALKTSKIQALGLNSKKASDDYEADFYGLGGNENIDIGMVINYLKSDNVLKINYDNYKSPITKEYQVIGTDGVIEVKRNIKIPFEYTNEYKQKIQSEIKCGINRRYDYVENFPHAQFVFTKNSEFRICYFYDNTQNFRKEVVNTISENDFYLDDKYVAIQFVSKKINDLYHILIEIQGENNAVWYKNIVNKTFEEKFKNCQNAKDLIHLYENAPDFTLANLKPEILWQHICKFYSYDTSGAFSFLKDASPSLMRALFAFNTPEKIAFLMKMLNENQYFIYKLYHSLDDEISYMGEKIPCKIAFISVISSFATVSLNNFNFTNECFKIGKESRVIVEEISSTKTKENTFKKKYTQKEKSYTSLAPSVGGGVVAAYDVYLERYSVELLPLDMVTLYQDETKSLLCVPALFLYHEDFQKSLEATITLLRIGLDALAVALLVTSGGSSGLLASESSAVMAFFGVLAAVDGTLALGDIAVQLSKDRLSKEFLDTWEKIYFIGGTATASPLVVASLYKLGGKILTSSAQIEMKNFVRSCMIKIFLEREISNFRKNTVKVLITHFELAEATKGALTEFKAKTLNQYGILIIEGEFKTGKTITKEAALVYKGEIILHAERYNFFNKSRFLLKKINNEKEFIKLADELLVYGKEYPVNDLKPLITEAQAMLQYGNAGKGLVNAVDKEVQHILQNFIKADIEQKVMVSGMVYKKGFSTKYYTATNFLKKEIDNGIGKVYVDFIKNLHPTLELRLDKHIAKLKMNGVLATKIDLLRAGKIGSHGEIRALDKLLKEIDPHGQLGEAVFQDILGYNRFLWQIEKIQPPCAHCYYLTSGVKFIGF